MKLLFSLFSLIVFQFTLVAQQLQWEKVYQKGFTHEIKDVKRLPGDKYLIVEDYLASDYRYSYVNQLIIDSVGIVTSIETFHEGYRRINQLVGSEPQLISIGKETGYGCNWCALGYPEEWTVAKFNLMTFEYEPFYWYFDEYNIIEQTENWVLTSNGHFPEPVGFFFTNDSIATIAGDSGIVRISYDIENEVINSYKLLETTIQVKGLFQYSDSSGIAFTQDAIYSMNSYGEVEFLLQLPFSIDSIVNAPEIGNFICYSGNSIKYLDSDGNILNDLIPENYFDVVKQFEINATGFRGLGWIDNEIHLKEFVNSLEVLDFIPDTSKFEIQQFAFNETGDAFYLFGNESAVDNKHLLIQKYSNATSSFTKSEFNLGLSDLVGVNTVLYYCKPPMADEWYPNNTWPLRATYISADVTVTNFSAISVDTFYLNGDYEFQGTFPYYNTVCNVGCGDSYFSKLFIEHLEPNESKVIRFGFLNGNDALTPLPICVWVTSPNMQPDRNPLDDKSCISVTVGQEEIEAQNSKVYIYPNPAYNQLTLRTDAADHITSISIVDSRGRIVLSQTSSTNLTEVNVSTLTNGLYFIQIQQKSGKVSSERIIVQK
jgi:hypothetical protein